MMLCSANFASMSQLLLGKYAEGVPYRDEIRRLASEWCSFCELNTYESAGVNSACPRSDRGRHRPVTARPEPRLDGSGGALHDVVS